MDYLLDTHTLIWFLSGDEELSAKARSAIEAVNTRNFVSIASLWEISIKLRLGRLELNVEFEAVAEEMLRNGFQILPISFRDVVIQAKLPFHHRDPFDRMLISQTISNRLVLISKDSLFTNYNIEVIW